MLFKQKLATLAIVRFEEVSQPRPVVGRVSLKSFPGPSGIEILRVWWAFLALQVMTVIVAIGDSNTKQSCWRWKEQNQPRNFGMFITTTNQINLLFWFVMITSLPPFQREIHKRRATSRHWTLPLPLPTSHQPLLTSPCQHLLTSLTVYLYKLLENFFTWLEQMPQRSRCDR